MGSGPGGEGVAEGLGTVQGKLEPQDREDMGTVDLDQEPGVTRGSSCWPRCAGLVTIGQFIISPRAAVTLMSGAGFVTFAQ